MDFNFIRFESYGNIRFIRMDLVKTVEGFNPEPVFSTKTAMLDPVDEYGKRLLFDKKNEQK